MKKDSQIQRKSARAVEVPRIVGKAEAPRTSVRKPSTSPQGGVPQLAAVSRGSSAGRLTKQMIERVGRGVTSACIVLVALLVVTLVAMVAGRGIATFTADGIDLGSFLTGTTWNPHQDDVNGMPTVGALPMIAGSFSVTLLSTLFALPIAFGSAIFVVEVAPRFGRRVFQPLVELLVGIPSVVYGLIGLTVIVAWVRGAADAMGQTITGFGIFSSAVVLAVMILPTITSLSIDALAAVPQEYREGSYALGCTR